MTNNNEKKDGIGMTKEHAISVLKELKSQSWEPWSKIHGLILEMDGSHNRIYGLGIKHHTMQVCDAIGELISDIEKELSDEREQKYIELCGGENTEKM